MAEDTFGLGGPVKGGWEVAPLKICLYSLSSKTPLDSGDLSGIYSLTSNHQILEICHQKFGFENHWITNGEFEKHWIHRDTCDP